MTVFSVVVQFSMIITPKTTTTSFVVDVEQQMMFGCYGFPASKKNRSKKRAIIIDRK